MTTNQNEDPGYARYINPGMGAREKLMVERAYALADQGAPPPVELPRELQSIHRQDFVDKPLPPAESLGRKVMMTQNMIDIKGAGDGLWRKEADIVSRHLVVEGTDGGFNQTFTHTGVKPKFGFGKDSAFSTPVDMARTGAEHNS